LFTYTLSMPFASFFNRPIFFIVPCGLEAAASSVRNFGSRTSAAPETAARRWHRLNHQ